MGSSVMPHLAITPPPVQPDVALYYQVDVQYFSGKQGSGGPTYTFTVNRWGSGSNAAYTADVLSVTKLVLPIDLSTAKCYQDDSGTDVTCGAGKYLVTEVRAYRWVSSATPSDSDSNDIGTVGPWTDYTFVGELQRVVVGLLAKL